MATWLCGMGANSLACFKSKGGSGTGSGWSESLLLSSEFVPVSIAAGSAYCVFCLQPRDVIGGCPGEMGISGTPVDGSGLGDAGPDVREWNDRIWKLQGLDEYFPILISIFLR